MTAPPSAPETVAPAPRARRSGWSWCRPRSHRSRTSAGRVRLVLPGVAAPRPAHRPGPRPADRPAAGGRTTTSGRPGRPRAELPDARDAGPPPDHAAPWRRWPAGGRCAQLQPMTSLGRLRRADPAAAARAGAPRAPRRCSSARSTCASRSTASPRSAPSPGAAGAPTPSPPGWRASTAAGGAPPCRSAEPGNDSAPAESARRGRWCGAARLSGAAAPWHCLYFLPEPQGHGRVARRSPWCRRPSPTWPPWPRPTPSASRPASGRSRSAARRCAAAPRAP